MENPVKAFEGLPKNQKLIVVGGAVVLGGVLIYAHHKKQQSQDAGANTDASGDSTVTDGTASSGVQDNGTAAYDQYANDEGIVPYQNASDPYGSFYGSGGGGGGLGYAGGASAPVGAGDIGNQTLTLDPAVEADLAGIASGLAGIGVTGGGAPESDPTLHQASRTPTHAKSGGSPTGRRKTTGTPHQTTQHKTNAPKSTNTSKSRTNKSRPSRKPQPKRRTVGARMSF